MRSPILMFMIIGGFVLIGCSSSGESVKTTIVQSKIAYRTSDGAAEVDFPPVGVLRNNAAENPELSIRRFFRANDTIAVNQLAQPKDVCTPVYPDEARKRYMEGTVWLRLWITEEGTVKQAKVEESTDVIFNESALEAGMNCRFNRALKDDKPIQVTVYLPMRYKLK